MSRRHPTNYVYGDVITLAPANPAAGAGAVVTVPTGRVWRPRSVAGTLTTSAAVATRFVFVQAADAGAAALARTVQVNGIAAGLAANCTFAQGAITNPGSVQSLHGGLFDLHLTAGQTLTLSAIAIQAGDQFSVVRIVIEQWFLTG